MDGDSITATINKGQRVRLNCDMIFGAERGTLFIWFIPETFALVGDVAVVVVTPDADIVYECSADRLVGKTTRSAQGTVNIIVRGMICHSIHYNVLAEVYAFANSVIYTITMCLLMLNFAINNVP